jgi:hypothetical protein
VVTRRQFHVAINRTHCDVQHVLLGLEVDQHPGSADSTKEAVRAR